MIDAIKLLAVFLAIIVALNRRLELGAVLAAGAIVLGLLFGRSVPQVALDVWNSVTSFETLRLVAIVLCIMILSEVQRAADLLEPMVRSLLELFSDARVVLAIVPALIGLLPMPGGAMLSAPMVQEAGRGVDITDSQKTFANYWFRHVWEYVVPLYPALVLTAVLLSVPLGTFIRHQWPLTLAAILGGALIVWTTVPKEKHANPHRNGWKSLLALARSVWPVALIVVLTMSLDLDMLITLPLVILLLILVERLSWSQTRGAVIRGLDWHIALVLVGVMIFKHTIEVTGAVEHVSSALASLGVPPLVLIGLIPFIVGLATGVTAAAFGVGVPVILPLLVQMEPSVLSNSLIVYAGGMAGVMLSPVHLCLILTRDYFHADWLKTLLPVALAQGIVVATAVVLAVVGF